MLPIFCLNLYGECPTLTILPLAVTIKLAASSAMRIAAKDFLLSLLKRLRVRGLLSVLRTLIAIETSDVKTDVFCKRINGYTIFQKDSNHHCAGRLRKISHFGGGGWLQAVALYRKCSKS